MSAPKLTDTVWLQTWTHREPVPAVVIGSVAVHYAPHPRGREVEPSPDRGLVMLTHAGSGWKFASFTSLQPAVDAARDLAAVFECDSTDGCEARDLLILAGVHDIVEKHGGHIGRGHLACSRIRDYSTPVEVSR